MATSGLSSLPAGGITSLLEQTLDLIGEEYIGFQNGATQPSSSSAASQERTAASLLLEERQRSKQALDIKQNFVYKPIPKPSPTGGTPFLEQISNSHVVESRAHKKGKVAPAKSQGKSSYGKAKGENYSNRFKEKLVAKAAQAKLKNKLKSS